MILQSVGRDGRQDIAFTVVGDYADDAMKTIEAIGVYPVLTLRLVGRLF